MNNAAIQEALRPGSRIGTYTVREEIAPSRWGVVFRAEQDASDRVVALHVLSAVELSPTALARFRYEAQALTSLRHPGIAPAHEAGIHTIDDGAVVHELPWLATELVAEARPLAAYADAQRLGREERLRLFLQVCDAVQHGHQKGVVHRALAADTILIDASGRPRVIDFGLERALEAGGDVRTDVHALGVVLRDLLGPMATGDLDAILRTALEDDEDRRYASANALAADLRRYLEHRPIEAHAGSALYPIRLFARRHRLIVGAIAALVILSLAAAAISITYAIRSERELRELRREMEAD